MVIAVSFATVAVGVVRIAGVAASLFFRARRRGRKVDVLRRGTAFGSLAGFYERGDDLCLLQSVRLDADGLGDLAKFADRLALELGSGAHVLLSARRGET